MGVGEEVGPMELSCFIIGDVSVKVGSGVVTNGVFVDGDEFLTAGVGGLRLKVRMVFRVGSWDDRWGVC